MKTNKLVKAWSKAHKIHFQRQDKVRVYKATPKRTQMMMRCLRNGTARMMGTISDGYVIPSDKRE